MFHWEKKKPSIIRCNFRQWRAAIGIIIFPFAIKNILHVMYWIWIQPHRKVHSSRKKKNWRKLTQRNRKKRRRRRRMEAEQAHTHARTHPERGCLAQSPITNVATALVFSSSSSSSFFFSLYYSSTVCI